jgi:hypothetical protein
VAQSPPSIAVSPIDTPIPTEERTPTPATPDARRPAATATDAGTTLGVHPHETVGAAAAVENSAQPPASSAKPPGRNETINPFVKKGSGAR